MRQAATLLQLFSWCLLNNEQLFISYKLLQAKDMTLLLTFYEKEMIFVHPFYDNFWTTLSLILIWCSLFLTNKKREEQGFSQSCHQIDVHIWCPIYHSSSWNILLENVLYVIMMSHKRKLSYTMILWTLREIRL